MLKTVRCISKPSFKQILSKTFVAIHGIKPVLINLINQSM